MLQETKCLYTFYGELNWDRKPDFCAPVLLIVLAILSQVLLQREVKCSKERKIILEERRFIEDGSFLDSLFLNSVGVIEEGLRPCSTYPFSFV